MPSFRDGTVNILGLVNPGVYVDQILPQPFINAVPTNIEGLVGVGSWGPVGSPQLYSSLDDCAAIFGIPTIRPYDIARYTEAALLQGTAIGFCGVRVTDGSDTAASATIQTTGGTATARYTGSRGNQITVTFQPTPAPGAYAAVISFPGRNPERFDNLFQALASVTTVPGTGYTSVPTVTFNAPQKAGGRHAVANATLKVVGVPTVSAGGSAHVVGDILTLSNGVKVAVATVTSGAVATVTLNNPGLLASGSIPTNPLAQTASTGSGIGASFTVAWGYGTPVIVEPGSGYTSITATTTPGAGGTGGSYTAVASFWAALANAVNNGTIQRARSRYIVFTPGSSTAAPTLATPVALTGGTDGDGGVAPGDLIGSNVTPRTGMFALRNTKVDCFTLCDVTDASTWSAQIAFGIEETCLPITATASGDTIEGAIATRISQGVDDVSLWAIVGDWPTYYSAYLQQSLLISPTAIGVGLVGNLSPEQSPINKRLNAVNGTQTSQTGALISDAEEASAQTGGVDIIGKASALNEDFFSFLTGRNASSNTAANGIEYTRLTNFIIRSLEGAATRSIVGRLQSIRGDDPTRKRAKAILDSFFSILANPDVGSDGYGLIDGAQVQCDLSNNPPDLQAQGFLFAFCKVRYLNVVRYFVIKLAGGGNVDISVQTSAPSVLQLAA